MKGKKKLGCMAIGVPLGDHTTVKLLNFGEAATLPASLNCCKLIVGDFIFKTGVTLSASHIEFPV